MTKYRISFALGLVAALVIVSVLASSGPSSDLRLLRSDPMSAIELSQASESSRRESDHGTTLGKQQRPEIRRTFLPAGDASAADVTNEAIEVARANGWDSVSLRLSL